MNVLNLVTNENAKFFQKQVETLESKGVNVTTISPGQQQTSQTGSSRGLQSYSQLYRQLAYEQLNNYDLIHVNYGLLAPVGLLQLHQPRVLTFWGSDIMAGRSAKVWSKLAYLYDEVIVPSDRASKHLTADHSVIPFGVDTELFQPISQDFAREIINWERDKSIVLFPYSPQRTVKNYSLAKEIVNNIDQEVHLRPVYGKAYEMMPAYMNASDAVLITSKRESGPMTVKEAACCNVPVISTDIGFTSEVLEGVSQSHVGSSVQELSCHLSTVLSNNQRSDGQKYAKEWGLDRMGSRILSIYESII